MNAPPLSANYPVTAFLWEWVVTRDSHGGPAGVARTRHGAMQALAKALIHGGRPAAGQIVPLTLTRPLHTEPGYQRGTPGHTATYDGQAIQWA
jgi:hypothetical protein